MNIVIKEGDLYKESTEKLGLYTNKNHSSEIINQTVESVDSNIKEVFYMGPRKTVLIAEDDESIRKMLTMMLERKGFIVILAENGEVAFNIVSEKMPDIVLMDQNMPKLDGIGAIHCIRDITGGKELPIILTSGSGEDPSFRKKILDVEGMEEKNILSKPIDYKELFNTITSILELELVD